MPPLTASLPPALTDRARDFWSWWRGELEAMLPEGVALLRKRVDRADIYPTRDGVVIDLERGGVGERLLEERTLEALDEAARSELAALIAGARARIVLGGCDVFVQRFTFPAAARARLRGAVALQLRQTAPVALDALAWNWRVVRDDGKRLTVVVAMARTARTSAIADWFESSGMPAPPIVARFEDQELELAGGFDGSLTPERRRLRRAFAIAAALIASVPLTTWTAAGVLSWAEEARARTIHEELAPRLAEDRARARDERARRALGAVFARPGASALLEKLALALPESAFALRAERRLDGRFVFAVSTSDPEAVEAALGRSPELDARLTAAGAAAEAGHAQLTFEARPR